MNPEQYDILFDCERRHWWFAATHALVAGWLAEQKPAPGSKVLDAGCGTGGLIGSIREAWPSLEICGTDSSLLACSYWKRSGALAGAVGEIEKLPFADESFDFVICIDVLYHRNVADPAKAVEELARVLKKGGRMFLHAPAFEWLRGSHDRAVWTGRRFDAREIESLTRAAKLELGRISYRCAVLLPLIWAARRVESFAPSLGREAGDIKSSPLQNLLCGAAMKIERALLGLSNLPLGSSIFCEARKGASA